GDIPRHVHARDLVALPFERIGAGLARAQRDFALRRLAAHQNRDVIHIDSRLMSSRPSAKRESRDPGILTPVVVDPGSRIARRCSPGMTVLNGADIPQPHDLPFEFYTRILLHALAHFLTQILNVGGSRIAAV